jgi:hypothetical protein
MEERLASLGTSTDAPPEDRSKVLVDLSQPNRAPSSKECFMILPDLTEFKASAEKVFQAGLEDPSSFNPHLAKSIYGLPVVQTNEPIIVSSITGAGKTYDLLQWLLNNHNYRRKGDPSLIIAFKEIKLLAEFVSEFYAKVKAQSISDYRHLNRYVSLVYGDTGNALETLNNELEATGSETAKLAVDFLENADASTKIRDQGNRLLKSSVIFTTHESLLNLGLTGLTEGRDIIVDEAPDSWVKKHLVSYGQTQDSDFSEVVQSHLDSYLFDSKLIDENKSSSRLGRKLNKKLFITTRAFQFTHSTVDELNGEGGDRTKKIKDSTPVGVFFSFCNLSAFAANSIMFLTAKPEGTQLRVLEQCTGNRFPCYETEASKVRRKLIKAACVFEPLPMKVSCSKASASSEEAKVFTTAVLAACKANKDEVLVVAHSWRGDAFKRAGLAVCKLNQTGSNVHQNRHLVCVLNLSFFSPEDTAIYGALFGDDFMCFQRDIIASNLGQSVMRSALRKRRPEACKLIAGDERVFGFFNSFVGLWGWHE